MLLMLHSNFVKFSFFNFIDDQNLAFINLFVQLDESGYPIKSKACPKDKMNYILELYLKEENRNSNISIVIFFIKILDRIKYFYK